MVSSVNLNKKNIYFSNIFSDLIGDIFVPTSMNYPYNLSKKEMILYEKYLEVHSLKALI